MKYKNIIPGKFISRPNRFIAYVEIEGELEKVHVKNTGRCKELLNEGVRVYLEKSDNPERKTAYDLIAVEKENRLINMDSQAPNKVVEEWLKKGGLFSDIVLVRPETTYGNSRFDFYVETSSKKIYIEVKGVTLEKNGAVFFPDAPSHRAVKHLEELIHAKKQGYEAYVIFVIQMKGVSYFAPNEITHEVFANTLRNAAGEGVNVLAYDCMVEADELVINDPVEIHLSNISMIPKSLLAWYDKGHRKLPWREVPEPYRVWISEIMLQQTRVEAVIPYFERFLNALPTIESLANVQEQKLLKLWEGLGYYNRVRNMQVAAKQIMDQYHGNMPDSYEELMKLKGIGSYTAGAIASIAFGKKIPAVDGNVLRVIARIRMDDEFINEESVKKRVEKDILMCMPYDRPGDFNQAIMELGAMVCIPNGMPHCEVCPVNKICKVNQAGVWMEYPKKVPKKERVIENRTILVIRDKNTAALQKRPEKGLLAGMYELPSLEGHKTAEDVLAYLAKYGLKPIRIQQLHQSKHIFSHKEWHMQGYMVWVDELSMRDYTGDISNWLFIEPQEVQREYPVPTAFAAYTKYLNMEIGNSINSRKK